MVVRVVVRLQRAMVGAASRGERMRSKAAQAILRVLNEGELELRPNFTKLAKQTSMPISSMFDGWQAIKRAGHISVFAIIGEEKKVVQYRTMQQKLDPTKQRIKKG